MIFRIINDYFIRYQSLIYGGERVYFYSIEMLLVMLLVRSLQYFESSNLHSPLPTCIFVIIYLLLPALCVQWVRVRTLLVWCTSLTYFIHMHVYRIRFASKNKFSLTCIVGSFSNFDANSCVSNNNPWFLWYLTAQYAEVLPEDRA